MTHAPVRTPHDLYQRWRDLMGPLGFGGSSLWLGFLDEDGLMNTGLTQIEDIPTRVDPAMCKPLLEMCRHILGAQVDGRSVALLLTRPGSNPMNEDDRSWARGLTAAAEELEVSMRPVHFANDEELLVFAPDDLISC